LNSSLETDIAAASTTAAEQTADDEEQFQQKSRFDAINE
jgi:hypothetical protein